MARQGGENEGVTTAVAAQHVAQAAAVAAAPLKKDKRVENECGSEEWVGSSKRQKKGELSMQEKAQQNRDRNREHARSTRLRKKAYINSLKEQVERLQAEKIEDERRRRVAIHHLSDIQNVRRAVVRSFLKFHCQFEIDPRKWSTIIEDDFWLKQPVTPYRFFRSCEIENEYRKSKGIDSIIADSASMSVMIEGIGSRNGRWMHLKRNEFLNREEMKTRGNHNHNHNHNNGGVRVARRDRLQHAISSLSSGSSNGSDRCESQVTSSSSDADKQQRLGGNGTHVVSQAHAHAHTHNQAKKVSSSSGSDCKSNSNSNDYHDYNAPSLPDPMLDSGNDANSCDDNTNAISTDGTSSIEDEKRNGNHNHSNNHNHNHMHKKTQPQPTEKPTCTSNSTPVTTTNERLTTAPAVPLPPFVGLGKRPPSSLAQPPPLATPATVKNNNNNNNDAPDQTSLKQTAAPPTAVTSNLLSKLKKPQSSYPDDISSSTNFTNNTNSNLNQIQAAYHINEDDMLITDDIFMCPFLFSSQDAVLCGALAECAMPGMLRAKFSPNNRLAHIEMVYDAMGFMNQLEQASGSKGLAQIVPNRLEMALCPNTKEARVITIAKAPFPIVSVNDNWTKLTKYTQLEVEGKALISILSGERTDVQAGIRPGKPIHDFEEVRNGKCACTVNVHYDKHGRDFVDYVCSYPLTNADDEVTHLLHIHRELPAMPSEFL